MSKTQSRMPDFLVKFSAPMTQHELVAATGLTQSSVSRFLHAMMGAEPRQAHIVDWRYAKADCGPPMAVYAKGPGEDAPCRLTKLSGAERVRKHRRKKRDLRERAAVHSAPRPDYLTAALFGMAA